MLRYFSLVLLCIASTSASVVSDLVVKRSGGGQFLALPIQKCDEKRNFTSVEIDDCTAWGDKCIVTKAKTIKLIFKPITSSTTSTLKFTFTPKGNNPTITTKVLSDSGFTADTVTTISFKKLEDLDIRDGDVKMRVEVLDNEGRTEACVEGEVKWSSYFTCSLATGLSGSFASAAIALLVAFKNL